MSAPPNDTPHREASGATPDGTRPRVLIAEDYPAMVVALRSLLSPDCDIVAEVADCGALLEATQRLQPNIIVLDLHLPGGNSLLACQEITSAARRTTVIIVTAGLDETLRADVIAAGASAFVDKSAIYAELLPAIAQAHRR